MDPWPVRLYWCTSNLELALINHPSSLLWSLPVLAILVLSDLGTTSLMRRGEFSTYTSKKFSTKNCPLKFIIRLTLWHLSLFDTCQYLNILAFQTMYVTLLNKYKYIIKCSCTFINVFAHGNDIGTFMLVLGCAVVSLHVLKVFL